MLTKIGNYISWIRARIEVKIDDQTLKLILVSAIATTVPFVSSFGFSDGRTLLSELKKYGFEAERVADYGCYCQFLSKDANVRADGQPMDEFDLVCFQYTQCLRCLDIDQCTHGIYKGYNEKNEFCNGSEYDCENNLCKCQKKLIQGLFYKAWFSFIIIPWMLARSFDFKCIQTNLQVQHGGFYNPDWVTLDKL